MNIFEKIKFLISSPKVPTRVEEREDALLREVVAGHSHGNLYLQMGLFDTKEDIDEQYDRVAKINFA